MGKDGLPEVTEEAHGSPWWLPLLGILVLIVVGSWVALGVQSDPGPATVKVQLVAPEEPTE